MSSRFQQWKRFFQAPTRESRKLLQHSLAIECLEDRRMLAFSGPGIAPFNAPPTATSSYMVGNVYVNAVLIESDGSGADPNVVDWDPAIVLQRRDELIEGLQWWETTFDLANPGSPHDLQFEIDFTHFDTPFQTEYEPMLHLWGDRNELWVGDYLSAVGANSVREWNNSQRLANGADWAITLFFVNGDAGQFDDVSGSGVASALGGAEAHFMTVSGPGEYGRLVAHEVAHLFYALDEYDLPHAGHSYATKSGYYGTLNLNGAKDNPDPDFVQESSIMTIGTSHSWDNNTLPESTREHVGWRDDNGNGTIDIFDEPFDLSGFGRHVEYASLPDGMVYQFDGATQPGLLEAASGNFSPPSSTLNFVEAIQFRIDSGNVTQINMAGDPTMLAADAQGWFTPEVHFREYEWNTSLQVDLTSLGSPAPLPIEFRTVGWNTRNGVIGDIPVGTTPLFESNIISETLFTPGIHLDASGFQTSEDGDSITITLTALTEPAHDVTIEILSDEPSEVAISQGTLTINSTNWDQPHPIEFLGVDDDRIDGDTPYNVTFNVTSTDTDYDGFALPPVALTNLDNDVAALVVSPGDTMTFAGLPFINPITVSENVSSATFEVSLTAQPDAAVTLDFDTYSNQPIVQDGSEIHLDKTQIVFTNENWHQPQTVTATGLNDDDADGDQDIFVLGTVTTDDPNWQNIFGGGVTSAGPVVGIVNEDNDQAADTTPPKIIEIEVDGVDYSGPSYIDNSMDGISSLAIIFSEDVAFTAADITIETVSFPGGVETIGSTILPTSVTNVGGNRMSVTLDGSLAADTWLKIGLNGTTIVASGPSGLALDGDAPAGGSGRDYLYSFDDLPSGDGAAGGDATFFVGNKAADLDHDGDVDISDILTAFENYTGPQPDPPAEPYTKTFDEGDVQGDGDVDTSDILVLNSEFTGPEPGVGGALDTLPALLGSPLHGVPSNSTVSPAGLALTDKSELQTFVAAAMSRWETLGITSNEPLPSVEIADLPDGILALTYSNLIRIDSNGNGFGWFVDTTPENDNEFRIPSLDGELLATPSSPAHGAFDLLTVVTHEIGHFLGLDHHDQDHNIMSSLLDVGVRRMPAQNDAHSLHGDFAIPRRETSLDDLFHSMGRHNASDWIGAFPALVLTPSRTRPIDSTPRRLSGTIVADLFGQLQNKQDELHGLEDICEDDWLADLERL